MRQARQLVALGLAAVLAAGCAKVDPTATPETTTFRTDDEQRQGDAAHRSVLQRFGGAYRDRALDRYISSIGRKMAAVSAQPNEQWTFTVLDSPDINAFAVPGGYVYVTRGLLALASDEAELAGVLGHEIGHVVAGHSQARRDRAQIADIGLNVLGVALGVGLAVVGIDPRLADLGVEAAGVGAVGLVQDYSRADELEADNLGVRYLAAAGYDPFAQADFIDSLGQSSALDARIAGRVFDPNTVPYTASHPANGPRVRDAIETARTAGQLGGGPGLRNAEEYLAAINGMPFGERGAQGVVDGTRFVHPALAFTYRAPNGYRMVNTPEFVRAEGPDGARLILEGGRNVAGPLTAFIRDEWVPQLQRSNRTGRLRGLAATEINGLDAAQATMPIEVSNRAYDMRLTAIRLDGRIYRFAALAPRGSGSLAPLDRAVASFRKLEPGEADQFRDRRISIVTVKQGDTVGSLSRQMRVADAREARFRVLNDRRPNEEVRPGTRVKLIR